VIKKPDLDPDPGSEAGSGFTKNPGFGFSESGSVTLVLTIMNYVISFPDPDFYLVWARFLLYKSFRIRIRVLPKTSQLKKSQIISIHNGAAAKLQKVL
jgi:hypothetical protein